MLTSISSDDVVEEETGVLDQIFAMVSAEDTKVTKAFILRFLLLSESHDFVMNASKKMLTFYSHILLSLSKNAHNKASSIV